MVIQSTPEFSMSKKDFPPLSGFASSISEDSSSLASWSDDSYHSVEQDEGYGNIENPSPLEEVVAFPDDRVQNIPQGMVKDQFGLMGLLSIMRAAETNKNVASLAFGHDLTSLGLDLNSSENLYHTFKGPWVENLFRPHQVDIQSLSEYKISDLVKGKLAKVDMSRYVEDVLFYIFYTVVRDASQIAAAEELYCRGWRYHMEEKIWMMPDPGCEALEKTTRGLGKYCFFDAQQSKKVEKVFYLDCSKLESRPKTPYETCFQSIH